MVYLFEGSGAVCIGIAIHVHGGMVLPMLSQHSENASELQIYIHCCMLNIHRKCKRILIVSSSLSENPFYTYSNKLEGEHKNTLPKQLSFRYKLPLQTAPFHVSCFHIFWFLWLERFLTSCQQLDTCIQPSAQASLPYTAARNQNCTRSFHAKQSYA